jgi:hypothetical protein
MSRSAFPDWLESMAATLTAVQVAFIEWTRHGKLRHPRLVGVP